MSEDFINGMDWDTNYGDDDEDYEGPIQSREAMSYGVGPFTLGFILERNAATPDDEGEDIALDVTVVAYREFRPQGYGIRENVRVQDWNDPALNAVIAECVQAALKEANEKSI